MKTIRTGLGFTIAVLALMAPGMTILAAEDLDSGGNSLLTVKPGDLWQAPPYNFVFGNHIDTHVQLKLKKKRGNVKSLQGYFYIYFTGEFDHASGLPIARHPRGASHDEVCGVSPIICVAGWKLRGSPGAAKFLYHDGVNGKDHPVWMVNRAEETTAPAAGMVIPQPGYYSHYHWLSTGSNDPRAAAVPDFCDKKNASALETKSPTAVDLVCEGWFLELKALLKFAFEHGGEVIPIRNGADLRSHLNIVTNYRADTVEPITETRTSGGH